MIKFWKTIAHWIAKRALADERDRLDRYARMLGREMTYLPARSTADGLREALRVALEQQLPLGITWGIEFRYSEEVDLGHIRVIVEQPANLGPRKAA